MNPSRLEMLEIMVSGKQGGLAQPRTSDAGERGNPHTIADAPSELPVILLVTTVHHDKTARLAVALSRLGCRVAVLCPPGHWVRFATCIWKRLHYAALRPLASLQRAIRASRPALIIPCDDRAIRHMHRLVASLAEADVRERLSRSLSPPENFGVIESRPDLLMLARECGVAVPDTQRVSSSGDLTAWGATHPLPWVLKSDGSWAGMGVRVVATRAEADRAFQEMRRPVAARFALGQCLLEWDFFWLVPWLTRYRPFISVQQYIPGRAANCAVACWHGALIAGVAVETVASRSPTEPATIVRIVPGTAMIEAAERLVRALQLTGLVGFDFQVHAESGTPYLLELNPRAVPLCHLPLGAGRDLAQALVARMSGSARAPRPAVTEQGLIAYFPDAVLQDPRDPLLLRAYHDAPWDEPALLRALLQPPTFWRRWLLQGVHVCTRMMRSAGRMTNLLNRRRSRTAVEVRRESSGGHVQPL